MSHAKLPTGLVIGHTFLSNVFYIAPHSLCGWHGSPCGTAESAGCSARGVPLHRLPMNEIKDNRREKNQRSKEWHNQNKRGEEDRYLSIEKKNSEDDDSHQ